MSQDNNSHSRIMSVNPEARTKNVFHWHAAEQNFTIETVRDDQDILEQNLLERNNINTSSWKGDFHKVGSIPLGLLMELREKGILQDRTALLKWLDQSENAPFRTRDGRFA